MVTRTNLPMTFHIPSMYGMDSLKKDQAVSKYICLGSASNICDNLPWHKELTDFITFKLKEGIPVLGIWFSHQLFAYTFGSKVDFVTHTQEVKSITGDLTSVGLSNDT